MNGLILEDKNDFTLKTESQLNFVDLSGNEKISESDIDFKERKSTMPYVKQADKAAIFIKEIPDEPKKD